MVKAIIDITQRANRVINIVKAKYDLRDKSEAINRMAKEFEAFILEPGLSPEFIKKMEKVKTEKTIRVKNFAKRYGID